MDWTRQGNWLAEELVSATRMMSIYCTICNKNGIDPSYPWHLQIEGGDHPVTSLSYSSPSSGAFIFVAPDQKQRHWQWGNEEDGGNGNGDCNAKAMGGSLQSREMGDGCVIVPNGNQRRRSCAAAVPANSRVPSHDAHAHAHKDDNNAMMMMTMMTTGSSSLTLHGRGWVGCKTG